MVAGVAAKATDPATAAPATNAIAVLRFFMRGILPQDSEIFLLWG
jgi:hypothetical protein